MEPEKSIFTSSGDVDAQAAAKQEPKPVLANIEQTNASLSSS
jgi:hypothetical protein